MKVFENRVLRKMLGSNMLEVMGGWRKLLGRSLKICATHHTSG
jgi:hypothetical protein